MKFGLSEKTIRKITETFAAYPQIDQAVIYGSRAKGNYKNGSDIDLTLYGSDLTFKLLKKIEQELDELLLPYKIDLSLFAQLTDPDFIDHIRRVGVVFYKRQSVASQNTKG